MEAVNWVCDDALDEHVWVSEHTISLQEANVLEALQYDTENLCRVQSGMSWFSPLTSLNNELVNDGVILEKCNEAVNMAFQSGFTLPCWRMNTPRSCFLRSIRALLNGMPERVWNLGREMIVWGLGERLDLLFDNGNSDNVGF